MQTPASSEIIPDMLEEEWIKFKFVEQQEIESIITDPIIILPVLDDKIGRKLPPALLFPIKDSEILRVRLRIFLSLRHIVYHLTMNDEVLNKRLK